MHVTTVDLSLDGLLRYQLHRFADDGFDVVGVSAPGPYVEALVAAGIPHIAVPSLTRSWTPGQDLRATGELVRLFRRERPTIVHTHNPKSGVLGRLAARLAGVPVIVNTVHGLYANPSLSATKRFVVDRSERWAMRLSHHELFQSRADYDRALRERMVSSARSSWLGNGVDLRRFDPVGVDPAAVAALRRRWGVPDHGRVVGVVARLVREKGYVELFEAAERLRRSHPDAVVVSVGQSEPTKSDGLTDAELERGRLAGVFMHGEGSREEMAAIYAAFDLFVLPSYREGMPRSLIEASAMERPVVATDIRGCNEVVDPGVTGLLVPAGDGPALAHAIGDMLDDPARAAAMGKAGRERATSLFDEDAVVARTLEVYRRLLRDRVARPRSGTIDP